MYTPGRARPVLLSSTPFSSPLLPREQLDLLPVRCQ